MVFSSSIFLFVFLPIVLITYFLFPYKYKNLILLIFSLIFYAWGEPKFILVMLSSIFFNYIFGILISGFDLKQKKIAKKTTLIGAILFNISLLFYFKYFNFFAENLNTITHNFFNTSISFDKVVLPIGISFFTFQAMSYIIDLYLKKIKVQKKITDLALYISLFPQLIAGPIVRYRSIERQLLKRHHNIYSISIGIRRFIAGLTKKVFFANILGEVADKIFALKVEEFSSGVAWLGIICYFFQIYFDFSGYSDMAIGLGRIFGFRFIENFNYPYISRSITEFWRRWHISLSSWFRDYLYIPLGGNRKGRKRTYINLLIVFVVTGFWHGAAWNFLVWGMFHGFFLIVEKILLKKRAEKLRFGIMNVYTLFVVVNSWVLFRARDLNYAISYYSKMYGLDNNNSIIYYHDYFLTKKVIIFLIGATIFSTPIMKNMIKWSRQLQGVGFYFERLFYIILIYLNAIFVGASTYNPFIYFRF